MIRLRVLGAFDADVNGGAVQLGGPRQRAVLALLVAARGDVVSVDRLIDGLWRGEPPAKAIASLQSYVANLRRVLEPDRPRRAPAQVLVSAAPGYAVRLDSDAVDAWRFERLARDARDLSEMDPAGARAILGDALALWRGDAFAEVADEEWAVAEAARLEEVRLAARELFVSTTLRSAPAADAVPMAEMLARTQPLREEGWRLLALALWGSGRQADALAALRRARRTLAEELGLDPGPALAHLEEAILAQRIEVLHASSVTGPEPRFPGSETPRRGLGAPAVPGRSPGQVPGRFPGQTPGPGRSQDQAPGRSGEWVHPAAVDDRLTADTARRPVAAGGTASWSAPAPAMFVGRAADLAALTSAAADVLTGVSRIALVTGEPGAGKSTLIGRLMEGLDPAEWQVAAGRCPETEGAPPAWAWVECLRPLTQAVPLGEYEAALAPLLGDGQLGEDDAAAGRFRLHRAVCSWLREVSRHPADGAPGGRALAIVLDDLHRADAETLALLTAVADELAGERVLLVAAFRPSDVTEAQEDTLAALARRSPLRLPLAGLSAADVETLVSSICDRPVDPEILASLADRTGGNPFYVREIARLLASEGTLTGVPDGVRDVLRRRLARLPAAAVSVLRLAAVVGREAEVELLVGAADADEDAVLDGLEAGVFTGLLTEPSPGRVRFVHALVRDTLYHDLSQVRLTRTHARVAATLETLHPDDLSALAHHHARAATSATAERAVDYSVRAAELATRRYAHDTAAELLVQALECFERIPAGTGDRDAGRVDLLGRLVRAQVRGGAVVSARDTRQRAIEIARGTGRDDLLVAAFTSWAEGTPWMIRPYGMVDELTVDLLTRLLRDKGLDPVTRCRLLDTLAAELEGEGDPRCAAAVAEMAELTRALDDPRMIALNLAAQIRQTDFETDADTCGRLAAELARLGAEHDLVAYRWFGEFVSARAAAACGMIPEMHAHLERSLEIARAYRMSEALAVGVFAQATLAHVAGRLDQAEQMYGEACETLVRLGSIHAVAAYDLAIYCLRLSQGRQTDYAPIAQQLYEKYGRTVADLMAIVLADAGQVEAARAIRHTLPPLRRDFYHSVYATLRGMAVVAVGGPDEAREMMDVLLPLRDLLAGTPSLSVAVRPVAHVLGDLALMLDRPEEAADHYTRAAEISRLWAAPHWAAEAEEALARVSMLTRVSKLPPRGGQVT